MERLATAVRDREKEKRQDLSVMAQSYIVLLTKRGAINGATPNGRDPNAREEQ